MHRVVGSYAFGIMFVDHPGVIYAVRKDSPLIVGVSTEGNFIASDVPAILKYTREVYFIENREIVEITDAKASFFNEDLEEITVPNEVAFVPGCTKDAFIKAYTANDTSNREWSRTDAIAYRKTMYDCLRKEFNVLL